MSTGNSKQLSIVRYFSEVTTELQKVSWPSKEATIQMTILVITVSTLVALYLGGLDYLFTQLMGLLIK